MLTVVYMICRTACLFVPCFLALKILFFLALEILFAWGLTMICTRGPRQDKMLIWCEFVITLRLNSQLVINYKFLNVVIY
jgi:hypothetical protein